MASTSLAQKATNTSDHSPQVNMAADVKDNINDTFVTQRAGKIVQGTPLYVPLVTQNEKQSPSIFENRHTLQSTLLLQKKKEMNLVQANLEKKRAEFSKRMEECREKQEELRVKQKQIRDRVTKFEKFLKENDAKRQRANVKALSEKKMREQKEMEYGQLQHLQLDLQTKTKNILKLIKKYQIYENYLQSVVDILPPDYLDINEPHVNDIIMRHKTLVETNEDLIQMVQLNQDGIEERQSSLTALIKNKNDLILVYNSQLGTQQKYLDKLKQESAYKEQRIEERDKTGKERSRMIGETKLAINNIYDRIVSYNNFRPVSGTIPGADAEKSGGNATVQINAPLATGGGAGLTIGWANPGDDPLLKEGDLSPTSLAEKLRFIQDRVLDLTTISVKAEQSMAQDRIDRQRKQAALAAEQSQNTSTEEPAQISLFTALLTIGPKTARRNAGQTQAKIATIISKRSQEWLQQQSCSKQESMEIEAWYDFQLVSTPHLLEEPARIVRPFFAPHILLVETATTFFQSTASLRNNPVNREH
ncbi:hypothetical protein BDR26DRAFT_938572 [Obelidium mucronatum]|nr:hypothetical protein BDR26DRAFT_938572 [Obelidium mucronatum]